MKWTPTCVVGSINLYLEVIINFESSLGVRVGLFENALVPFEAVIVLVFFFRIHKRATCDKRIVGPNQISRKREGTTMR